MVALRQLTYGVENRCHGLIPTETVPDRRVLIAFSRLEGLIVGFFIEPTVGFVPQRKGGRPRWRRTFAGNMLATQRACKHVGDTQYHMLWCCVPCSVPCVPHGTHGTMILCIANMYRQHVGDTQYHMLWCCVRCSVSAWPGRASEYMSGESCVGFRVEVKVTIFRLVPMRISATTLCSSAHSQPSPPNNNHQHACP